MNRMEFIGMAGAGAVAIAVGGWAFLRGAKPSAPEQRYRVQFSDAEWRLLLSAASYEVLRKHGTEKPFSSPLLNEHRPGIFTCAGCGEALFDSRTKFDSHTGWPSFRESQHGSVVKREDTSLGMLRTEVLCGACGGHLGHVFDDGPKPTGLRYCINGAAMNFRPEQT